MTNFDLEILRTELGVNPEAYAPALNGLASGELAWVVVSGKMTAGKDTVAPALPGLMPTKPVMLRYGDLMRAELDPALDFMRQMLGRGHTQLAGGVADIMDLPLVHAQTVVDVLRPEMVASNLTLTASHRTDGVRTVLQSLGDEWRCADHDDPYWAARATSSALEHLNGGSSVILTGGRFLPDVELPRSAGPILLRLDVTRETQLDRLRGRDGLEPSAETLAALDHPSETALDDYEHFDIRLNNDGDLGECIMRAKNGVETLLSQRRSQAA